MNPVDAAAGEGVSMLKKHLQDVNRRVQKTVSQISFKNKQMCMNITETVELLKGQLQFQKGGDTRAKDDANIYAKEKSSIIQEWVNLSSDIRRLAEGIPINYRL